MNLQPGDDSVLEFEAVERWTVMHCPIFDKIFLFVLAASFGISTGSDEFSLLPTHGMKLKVSSFTEWAIAVNGYLLVNKILYIMFKSLCLLLV